MESVSKYRVFSTAVYKRLLWLFVSEILQYYNLYNSLVKPDVHIGCRLKNESEFYNDDFVKKAYPIMERAEKAASDSVILERVKKVKLQVLASEYALHPQNFTKAGSGLNSKPWF